MVWQFKWKPSSRYSLVHLLPTSSSKSAPRPSVFVTFSQVETELALQSRTPFADWKVPRDPQCFSIFKCKSSSRFSLVHLLPTSFYRSAPRREIELSLQCCAHFVGLIFQKCFETRSFFNIFKWKSSSRVSPVALFVDHFPRSSRATAETETLLWRQIATLPEKIPGFATESVFNPEFTRSRSLTFPNYLHDDVVAMKIEVMTRLPSSWYKANHDNRS